MKEIQLTQGKVALVDDEDYERLMAMGKWWANNHNSTSYYAEKVVRQNGKSKTVKMHRVILELLNPTEHVDHIDGNGLNNLKTNMRVCTNAQNRMNSNKYKTNTSGFKGVSLDRKSGK